MYYNFIASAEESTVLAQYVREERAPYGSYRSEAALERALIRLLEEEGYAYLPIRDAAEPIANLRTQLSVLNDYAFTDAEWERFFKTSIAPASDGIAPKTRRIQTDYIQNLKRDDGTTKNIRLIDKEHVHNNRLQVINQYAVEGGANASNRLITDLMDFGRTFLARHTLLALLTRYYIFTTEEALMRPYQIAATERILSRIKISSNYKTWGRIEGGGYIWHTTGSGKTLTSFKTAQLASVMPEIDKVLFVVDRKDLDYQTMKEYDRFEKGVANSIILRTVRTGASSA